MTKGDVVLFYQSYSGMGDYHWFPFPYLYIGPFLEKAGFRSLVIDARVELDWRKRLTASLDNAVCVGVTSMSGPDIKDGIEAAKICKAKRPGIPVVWGGPHATVEPAQV